MPGSPRPTTSGRRGVKVAELLDAQAFEPTERQWVEPALLALLGIETGIGSEQLFGAWRTFFERLASVQPVILVFEDLHWADAGTLDFIDHLLEWSRAIPLYIVTLARPELIDRRPDWGAGRRNFTSLYLEPLPDTAMKELLAGLVPGLPDPTARVIVARAEGIPLYAVETVRMLVADGRLTAAGDGTFSPTGDLTTLAIPETLTALIAARLDGLEPTDRSLVMDAAVLGQSFTPAGLAVVSGIDEPALEIRLRALVRRELFAHETDPRSPERGQYVFVQALIREVAYNTLAKRDRKVRHLAAARFFESLETDEIAAALAGHYLAARDNADGPEADALGAQARLALRAAAERASALGSHEQAMALLEQALAVTTESADRADLLERAGDEASFAGHHEAAERHLRAAIEVRRTLGDRSGIAAATAALGRSLLTTYRTADAIEILEPALAEFAEMDREPAFIALGGQLARAHFLGDDNRGAIEVADRVLEAAEHADLVEIVADTLVTKGTALGIIGRVIEGLAVIRAGQAVAQAHDLSSTRLRGSINHAFLQASLDPRAALEEARSGLAVARRLGRTSEATVLLGNGVEAAIRTGDWAWAMGEIGPVLDERLEASDRLTMLGSAVVIMALRGESTTEFLDEIQQLVGDTNESSLLASLYAANAAALFATDKLADARVTWHRTATVSSGNVADAVPRCARAALWLRDIDAARADLALLDASGIHGPAVEADRATIRAGIAALEGRHVDAVAMYRGARGDWRDLRLEWDEALCGLDMALLLDPADPDVREAAEASREILERLGARPFVDRLDAALDGAAAPPATGGRVVPADVVTTP